MVGAQTVIHTELYIQQPAANQLIFYQLNQLINKAAVARGGVQEQLYTQYCTVYSSRAANQLICYQLNQLINLAAVPRGGVKERAAQVSTRRACQTAQRCLSSIA